MSAVSVYDKVRGRGDRLTFLLNLFILVLSLFNSPKKLFFLEDYQNLKMNEPSDDPEILTDAR